MFEEEKVKKVLAKLLNEHGYDLVAIKYATTSEGPQLQVVVDRDDPISLDDIVKLSDPISAILDKEDPIAGAYTLDISSLGAEKPIALEKLDHYVGKYLNLHLSHPYKGENILEGTLLKLDNGTVEFELRRKGRSEVASFAYRDIDKARLAIKF